MAWRTKIATVLLIDVGPSMSRPCTTNSGQSRAQTALNLALAYYRQKLFFNPKHEIGVVLFGSDVTKNKLADDDPGQYQNVHVARESKIDVADLEALQFLLDAQVGHTRSDALDGLIISIDMLHKRCGCDGKYAASIHMFTDAASICIDDPDFDEVIRQLSTMEKLQRPIKLSITTLGNQAEPWRTLSTRSPHIELVPIDAVERSWSTCSKKVEQRAKVRLNLEISPDVQIPVGIYGKTLAASVPSLKKRSRIAAEVMSKQPPGQPRTDSVMMERTFFLADDDAGEEVKAEDRIKGHRYGQNIVPMSEHDEAALMYRCERILKTLGFASASSIGPEHSVWQIEAVVADKGDRFAHIAFESLISGMIKENKVLIARYCYRNNGQPRVVALVPHLTEGSAGCLHLQYLPFTDDIREWTFASLPEPNPQQRSAVAALVDAMDLDSLQARSSQPATEVLRPENTNSPALSRIYDFIARRAVDSAAKVPAASIEHAKSLERSEMIVSQLTKAGCSELLVDAFSLEKVEKKTSKKRFWREAIAEKRKEAQFGEVDTKQIKVDAFKKDEKEEDKIKIQGEQKQSGGAASSNMAMAVPAVPALPPQVKIGTVDPVRDFNKWLAHRAGGHDTVGPAIEQMKCVIENLVEEGEDFHPKALSCLRELRTGCVSEGEVIAFNNFARMLRAAKPGSRKAKFWEKARENALGLITDEEAPTSTVTAEESRAFLAGLTPSLTPPPAPVAATAPLSDQALEDMIED